jgi:hypothetical protein
VLKTVPDKDLAVFVVWMSVLERDDLLAAREATQLLSDVRVRHYWDGQRTLGYPLARTLRLKESELAWDVYLLYGREALWKGGTLPAPKEWMHQLSSEGPERTLVGEELAMQVRRELSAKR